MTGHSNLIPTVDVSTDGKMIASASYDRTARLWDAKTGKLLRTLSGSRNAVMTVQFRPGNQEVATGDYSNTFRRWNASTGAYLTGLRLFAPIRAVAYDLTGQKIVTGSEKGATLWDLNGGGYAFTTTAFVRDLALRPDGKHIALARQNKTVDIYDMNTRQKVRTLSGHGADVFAVGYSSDGTMLASTSGKLHLWKTSDGSLIRSIAAHTGAVFDVTFHPTKPYVLTAGYDKSIKVWDVKTGALVQTLTGHTGPVYTISMSADGSVLASGSQDNTVRVWSCR
jgi:WD40 repeat protein